MAKDTKKAKDPAEPPEKDEAEGEPAAAPKPLKVKPNVERKVANPDAGGWLKPEGEVVKPSTYWERQLRRGVVVAAD